MDMLALTLPEEVKVGNRKHYRSRLDHGGEKIYILTPLAKLDTLKKRDNESSASLSVPCDEWTRGELNKLEQFVEANAYIPPDMVQGECAVYKPLWRGEEMMITLSRWCHFFKKQPNGEFSHADLSEMTGPGQYQFTIEAPHVYIGPHKAGHTHSISLQIVQVVFIPETKPVKPTLPKLFPQPVTVPPTPGVNSLFRPQFPSAV